MNELRSIAEAHASFRAAGRRSVLITLVDVRGSSYRRPGARMLVDEDGRIAGSVSGGCLEGDLAEHARTVLASGRPKVVSYDLSESDDLAWGLGMGCPGTLRVLLEPADGERVGHLARLASSTEPFVLCTVFAAGEGAGCRPGDHWVVHSDGSPEGDVPGRAEYARVREAALEVHRKGCSTAVTFGEGPEMVEVFVEYVELPRRLCIFGGGPDAAMLARFGSELGWEVTVVATDPIEAVKRISIDEQTAVVLMSHNFPKDRALLAHLIPSPAPYIGLLGAAARRDALLSDLDEHLRAQIGERLFAPVGLDIGADRPEEIALAVAAEISAVLAGRNGGFLRDRDRAIHDRREEEAQAG